MEESQQLLPEFNNISLDNNNGNNGSSSEAQKSAEQIQKAKDIDELGKKINATLSIKLEGYLFTCDIASDVFEDTGIDPYKEVIRLGFGSFDEFLASEHMKKYMEIDTTDGMNVVNQSGNSGGEQFSNGNEQLMLMAQQDSGIGDIDNDDNIGDHDDGNETKEEGEKKEEMEEEEEREEVERQEEELEEQMGEELEDTGSSEEVKTEDNDELGEEEESADPVLPEEVEHRNGGPEHLHGWFGADRVDFSRHPQAVAGEQPPQLCFDRVQAAGRGVRRRLMRKMGAWTVMPLYRSINF